MADTPAVGSFVFWLRAGRLNFGRVEATTRSTFTVPLPFGGRRQGESIRTRGRVTRLNLADEGKTWVRTAKEVPAMQTVDALTASP